MRIIFNNHSNWYGFSLPRLLHVEEKNKIDTIIIEEPFLSSIIFKFIVIE